MPVGAEKRVSPVLQPLELSPAASAGDAQGDEEEQEPRRAGSCGGS